MSNLNESEQSFVHLIPNKLLKRLPNFIEKYYFLPELLTAEHRLHCQYGITQVNPYVTLHLCNSNKQQQILTKFYTSTIYCQSHYQISIKSA